MEILKYNPTSADAIKHRSKYPSLKEAWDNCPRGDWMIWLAVRIGVDSQLIKEVKLAYAKRAGVDLNVLYGDADTTYKQYVMARAAVYDDSESPADIAALLVRYSGNSPDICRQLLTEPVLKHFNQ